MSVVATALVALSCILAGASPTCGHPVTEAIPPRLPEQTPVRVAEALDVVLSAQAALVWDVSTGATLYQKNARERRPVASLSKLLSTLVVSHRLAPEALVKIPAAAGSAQRLGVNIRLPIGEHARVDQLLAASLIPSANDAIVSLAYATATDEAAFVEIANEQGRQWGLTQTKLANASGLPGGEQYSTAEDVRTLLTLAWGDPQLRKYLNDAKGSLTTAEGTTRHFESTNELLKTYLPIVAAKTGYTLEAGENIALLTSVAPDHTVGIVILGSTQRFQDAKILAEWIDRHYTWPTKP